MTGGASVLVALEKSASMLIVKQDDFLVILMKYFLV